MFHLEHRSEKRLECEKKEKRKERILFKSDSADKLIFPLCMHLVGRHLVRFWRMFGRFGYCDVDFEIILVMGLTNDIHLDVQL